jgi:hypothetical protein
MHDCFYCNMEALLFLLNSSSLGGIFGQLSILIIMTINFIKIIEYLKNRKKKTFTNIFLWIYSILNLLQFQLSTGTSLQFWHDCWLQLPLKLQYPHLFRQVQYTDISILDCYQQEEWSICASTSLDHPAQRELDDLMGK